MTIAYHRKFGTAYEIVGAGKMHSNEWQHPVSNIIGVPEQSPSVDNLGVAILRNEAGEIVVCPQTELNDLFEVVT